MNSLIKWPGGKAREIKYIEHMIPHYERFIEPFFGGGAMYFHLKPKQAIINDISSNLMDFYELTKSQDKEFHNYLLSYNILFKNLLSICEKQYEEIHNAYSSLKNDNLSHEDLSEKILSIITQNKKQIYSELPTNIILNYEDFEAQLVAMSINKFHRTIENDNKKSFSESDLKENLITGFTSGLYMYFRDVYNDINLSRNKEVDKSYRVANFYFIREYCYGSMFRYNSKGEFNIPYGGMSYNRKDFGNKINNIFSPETEKIFSNTEIDCQDFDEFIKKANLTNNDFMFLDPPYDTNFSDYEGKDFSQNDQRRLAEILSKTLAKFILIIKNTDFIYSLYKDNFNILFFDKKYTYNVRSRNDRDVEHLIITNLPV